MRRAFGAVASAATLLLTGGAVLPALTALPVASAGTIVEAKPAAGTPHVLDGAVRTVTRVGDRIVLGGSFTQVREDGSDVVLTRTNLLSFDPSTGVIDPAFAPEPDGTVQAVAPGPDAGSVYVGGEFSQIGGVSHPKLALVHLADGTVDETFDTSKVAGKVKDLAVSGGRLWVAGAFTHIAGHPQAALATVDPLTGAFDPFMSLVVSGQHNGGFTSVGNIDITEAGDRLVATGNFSTVDGSSRDQLTLLELGAEHATLSSFRTRFYEPLCRTVFNSYVDDAAFSPDGSYFVVVTTGGWKGYRGPCDSTARFETAAVGPNAQYSWLNRTGGDSTYAVRVTDSVVYVGGHPRWQNNTYGNNEPGPGAVSRPGVAALDPDSGLPLTWNPTKQRGLGVFDLFLDELDPLGLWIASDTTVIAGEVHSRIARMPDQGREVPAYEAPTEAPTTIYLGGVRKASGSLVVSRTTDGTTYGPETQQPAGDLDWTSVQGGFWLDGQLYAAMRSGDFVRLTFDGTSYGPAVPVNTSDLITPLTEWHDDIAAMTAMFFDRGRIYFTKEGSTRLFYRYFSPESDVVGTVRRPASLGVPGVDFSRVIGMALAGDQLYMTTRNGRLRRVQWSTGTAAGQPVPGTASTLSGPKQDGIDWRARTILLPDPS